jgi:hypothetical protein
MTESPINLDVDALFISEIAPALAELEAERKSKVSRFWTFLTGGGIGGVILGALGQAVFHEEAFVVIFVILFVLSAILGYYPLTKVSKNAKEQILGKIAPALNLSFVSDIPYPDTFASFNRYGCLPGFDRSGFEDQWSGSHRGRNFLLYEAHLERESRDKEGKREWTTVFRGQLIRLELLRPLHSTTVLKRDAGIFNKFTSPGDGFKRIGFPVSTFEKAFEAWGTDQMEARYILDPVVMEKLIALETTLAGGKIRGIFEGEVAYLMVEGRDLFEIGNMFETLLDPTNTKKIAGEVESLRSIMDVLADRTPAIAS